MVSIPDKKGKKGIANDRRKELAALSLKFRHEGIEKL